MVVLISCFVNSECDYGTMDRKKVEGKIIMCRGIGGDAVVLKLGGAATIMADEQFDEAAFPTLGAGTFVSVDDGQRIERYINSTRYLRNLIQT